MDYLLIILATVGCISVAVILACVAIYCVICILREIKDFIDYLLD